MHTRSFVSVAASAKLSFALKKKQREDVQFYTQ
jgi:hypothetical protein